MDWLTFFSNIVESLVWPATVIVAIYLMREKLGELLPRLKRFKHKDTEVEFAQAVEELALERAQEGEVLGPQKRSKELNELFGFLMQLAEISPCSAVLESFRTLETAAAKKVARLYPDSEHKAAGWPLQLQRLLKGEVLSKDDYYQFNQLRKLRNEAAHTEGFDVRGKPIEAYIDIALSLAARLERDAA